MAARGSGCWHGLGMVMGIGKTRGLGLRFRAIQLKLPKGPPWLSNWGNVKDSRLETRGDVLPTQLDFWTPPKSCTDVSFEETPPPPSPFPVPVPSPHPCPWPYQWENHPSSVTFCVCEIQDGPVFIYFRRICFKIRCLDSFTGWTHRTASRRHIALLAINFDPVSLGSVTVTVAGRIICRGVATMLAIRFSVFGFWFMTHRPKH